MIMNMLIKFRFEILRDCREEMQKI